jgi:hypothetical protein
VITKERLWVRFVDVYVGPGSPGPTETRAAVLGEFGGLGLILAEHTWNPSRAFSYEMTYSQQGLQDRYLKVIADLGPLIKNKGLSAAVYTELTDVEDEVNGYYTYDRQMFKMTSVDELKKAHTLLIELSRSI